MAVVGSGPEARAGSSADSFDVRVVAWTDPGPSLIERLQELFGIEPGTAQRIVDEVPVIVKRGATIADAQSVVQALEALGAAVVIERATVVSAERSIAAAPPPSAAATRVAPPTSLPRPPPRRQPESGPVVLAPSRPLSAKVASRVPNHPGSRDISHELLGNDGGYARSIAARPGRTRTFDDSEQSDTVRRAVGRRGQRDLDLAPAVSGTRIDLAGPQIGPSVGAAPASAPQPRVARSDAAGGTAAGAHASPAPSPALGPKQSAGAVPMDLSASSSMSASAAQRGPQPPPGFASLAPKAWAVVFARLAGSLLVFAAGLFIDDTIVRGNATVPSLVLHAVAIYQFGLGLRGAMR